MLQAVPKVPKLHKLRKLPKLLVTEIKPWSK